MPDEIRVRHLMLTVFPRIRDDQTLGDAMAALLEAQRDEHVPNALMVVDAEGRFTGMLTAKLLNRCLLAAWSPTSTTEADEERLEAEVLAAVGARLADRIADSRIPEAPVLGPDDRLLTAIRRGVGPRLDFMPVIEDGLPVGLAPITAIFQAAASIALTPEHEGIRFDQK